MSFKASLLNCCSHSEIEEVKYGEVAIYYPYIANWSDEQRNSDMLSFSNDCALLFRCFYWCRLCGAKFDSGMSPEKSFWRQVDRIGKKVFSRGNYVDTSSVDDMLYMGRESGYFVDPRNKRQIKFDTCKPAFLRLEGVPPLFSFGSLWMLTLKERAHNHIDAEDMSTNKATFLTDSIKNLVSDMLLARLKESMCYVRNGLKYNQSLKSESAKTYSENPLPLWDNESGIIGFIKYDNSKEEFHVDSLKLPGYLDDRGRMSCFVKTPLKPKNKLQSSENKV